MIHVLTKIYNAGVVFYAPIIGLACLYYSTRDFCQAPSLLKLLCVPLVVSGSIIVGLGSGLLWPFIATYLIIDILSQTIF